MSFAPSKTSRRPPKLDAACACLEALADDLGPDAKLPTVLQLRDQLGVSITTLHSALGELEARKRILRRHGVGIFVAPRPERRSVCLVCDPAFFQGAAASPFWNLLVEQVRARAEAGQEEFAFHFAHDGDGDGDGAPVQEGLRREIEAGRVDGVLAVGLGAEAASWLEARGVSVVAFAGYARCSVALDGDALVWLAVSALADAGCRRIGLWSAVTPFRTHDGPLPPEGDHPPVPAFRDALAARGLPFERRLVRDSRDLLGPDGVTSESQPAQGYRTAWDVFGASDPPDGVVSTNDMLTQGALAALQKRGIRVGRDVRVATHANAGSPALVGREDDLVRVEVDPAEIVRTLFTLLETLMDGRTPEAGVIEIQPKLCR